MFLQCLLSWLSVCIDGPPLLYRLRLGSDLSSRLKQSRCTKRYPCDAGYAGIWAASTTISFFISSCSGIEYFRSDEEQGAQARFLQVRVLTGKDQGAQDQDADVRVLTGKDHGAQALAIQASCWMPLQCRLAVQCSAVQALGYSSSGCSDDGGSYSAVSFPSNSNGTSIPSGSSYTSGYAGSVAASTSSPFLTAHYQQ